MPRFGRLLTAMVTPFDADLRVDLERAKVLARRLVAEGSDGIVVAGTTGESPTLDDDEKLRLFGAVLEAVGDQATVVAGTGNNNTAASLGLTRRAEALGVHGIMLVGPYYNKPTQEGYVQHFSTIAAATSLPVMLYNVPGRTASNITAETTLRLAKVENIVAIKEASGDLEQIAQIIQHAGDDFTVYSGDDSATLPIMSLGGAGVVSVAAHLIGPQMKAMISAFVGGQLVEAARLHRTYLPVMKGLFAVTNPVLVKAGLALRGFPVGGLRLPLVEATADQRSRLRQVLTESGLL